MNWQLLPTLSAPMLLQMACDEVLLESFKKQSQTAVLRFYVSPEPWISVGCSFRNEDKIRKSDLVRKNSGVGICRRITGGGCVLHGEDLIFSLVVRYAGNPLEDILGTVKTSYAKIHEAVCLGFRECGLDPRFYRYGEDLPKGNDCFDFPVESDLSWKGKKIAGGAQKRSEGVLLHHESISIPKGVDREFLIRAMRHGMETVLGVTIVATDLVPEVFFEAERRVKAVLSEN